MLYLYAISTALLLFNIYAFNSALIGAFLLLVYLVLGGFLAGRIIARVLPIQGRFLRLLVGIFLIFTLINSITGVFIIFYKFTTPILSAVVLGASLLILGLYRKFGGFQRENVFSKARFFIHQYAESFKKALMTYNPASYKTPFAIGVFLLFAVSFYTLVSSAIVDGYFMSPWQAIPSAFVWVMFLLSIGILLMIFFKPNVWALCIIILFSFLVHLYIPAVYRLPYGLDDWRHIGAMEKIVEEGVSHPYVFTPYTEWSHIGPVKVPTAVVSPKASYGSFWAAALFLNKTLHIGLVPLTAWWQYAVFSLFVPILLYLIGQQAGAFFRNRPSIPLLAAYLSAFFYPLQVYGGISLPIGYGFLLFLFFLFTVLVFLADERARRRRALMCLMALEMLALLFGYVIYFLIALLMAGFLLVARCARGYEISRLKKAVRILFLFGSIWFIPIVSLLVSPNARFDIQATQISYFKEFLAETVVYLFGFTKIDAARPQAGNLIWHDMRSRFVELSPFNLQYFDTVLLIFVLIILLVGLKTLLRLAERRNVLSSFAVFLVWISVGSIAIDRYYFKGIYLLTERMDLMVNAGMIFLMIAGVLLVQQKVQNSRRIFNFQFSIFPIAISVFLSFVFVSTYISGPVYGRVTDGQYKTIQTVYQDMADQNRKNYCVLAEHFPLAALEAVSKGEIVNGNFPIKYGYLEGNGFIFVKMFSDPHLFWMKKAMSLADAKGCYVVLDKRFLADWNKTQIRWILGREVFRVDDNVVWRYDGEKK